MEQTFDITLTMEDGDEISTCVTVTVTDEEYDTLLECAEYEEAIEDYTGLEELMERIREAAEQENEGIERIFVEMPDDIAEEAGVIDMEDYFGCPFSMEVVNFEVLHASVEFLTALRQKTQKLLKVREKELHGYIAARNAEDEGEELEEKQQKLLEDDRFAPLAGIETEELNCFFGYDDEEDTLNPRELRFEDCTVGWELVDLIKALDFDLEERVNDGPHGHGSYGVYYIECL